MCVLTHDFNTAEFFFLTTSKNLVGSFGKINGFFHEEYITEQERYNNIASFFVDRIPKNSKVMIEDYSFGSTGRVFNIAENCGLLKFKLWDEGKEFQTVAPTAVKKFATGKGNANKEKMYEAFLNETGVNLSLLLTPKATKCVSPVSDIVDSFYIAMYCKSSSSI
jgi:Holliday junction resolvasome RuvABC endonuclease subunit